MLKQTIEYEDFDGNLRTDVYYFHMSTAELAEMNLSIDGGMEKYLTDIIKNNERGKVVQAFKDILVKSVGERSEDGRRFVKTEDIRDAFVFSNAYDYMFIKLLSDAEFAARFVNGVFPKELTKKLQTEMTDKVDLPSVLKEEESAKKSIFDYTDDELDSMSREDLMRLVKKSDG